jgi:hypothetical protein
VLVLDPQRLVLVHRHWLVRVGVVLGACGDLEAVFAGAGMVCVIPHAVYREWLAVVIVVYEWRSVLLDVDRLDVIQPQLAKCRNYSLWTPK